MSLVGSLEDLGLGDILQIITLSRKSGSLHLRTDDGEGRLIFRDGLVCGARVKGRTPDLRGLVVDREELPDEAFEALRAEASARGVALAVVLADQLTAERFEQLRRECVERAVLDMFEWEAGEFSFEVGEDSPDDEFEVILDAGINAQYLAMEGTRRTDEGGREPDVDPGDESSFADLAEEIAADEVEVVAGSGHGPADAFEAVALTTVERVDGEAGPEAGSSRTEDAVGQAFEAALVGAEAPAEPVPAAAARPAVPTDPARRPPVVVVDPDLPVLEWVKRTLEGDFCRVHIFQNADLAVQRLRQYTGRGDRPLVLVSRTGADGSTGSRSVGELVARMKKQSPRSPVLWLGECDELGPADGAAPRAEPRDAASAIGPGAALSDGLRDTLLAALGEPPRTPPADPAPVVEAEPVTADGRLAEVEARLCDPETRGEVLNVALEFAAEHFNRVALLAVRGGEAEGLAGLGLERAHGPDDATLRCVRIPVAESRWLEQLVTTRAAVRAPAAGPGDHALAGRLGDAVAPEAWLAPVISGDQVVAVLYGDNLPGAEPLGPSEALEAALARAGQVLDQAVEERARGAG